MLAPGSGTLPVPLLSGRSREGSFAASRLCAAMLPHMFTWIAALALGLPPLLASGPQSEEAGPEPSPYARWELGPPTDPSFFPIGVWLQDPRHGERYKELGINTFVGLWQGPTEEQLASLKAAGLRTICAQNRVARGHADDPTIMGWLLADEPDNKAAGRNGPRASPAEMQRSYEQHRKRDPKRPILLNLGQGVANDGWKGRGAARTDYPAYAQAADILSFDVYPVANTGRSKGREILWWVAKGVRRLQHWGGDERIVWNFIETTSIHDPQLAPTPRDVHAEVWMSIIAGSRGIVYFVHSFEPELDAAALLKDTAMMEAVGSINRELLSFAPILNGPTLERTVVESDGAPVGVLIKSHGDKRVLFTAALRNQPASSTIRLVDSASESSAGGWNVRVLKSAPDSSAPVWVPEENSLQVRYAPYEVRVFELTPR